MGTKADQTLERKFKVHLKGIDDQQLERCRYPQSEQESSVSESSAEYELKGAVLISSSQNQLQFAGKERLVSPDVFSSLLDGSHSSAQDTLDILQRSAYWTKRMSINKRAEKNLVPDKAIPHCAVIFSRKKLTDSPQAKLTIQWAVFLPMSGQDQDQSEQEEFQEYKCTGDYDYTLLLHGYFFLDSGRRYIHSLKSIIADSVPPEVPTSIDKMNRQWNRLLATHGTLRLILPALHQFVATHKLSDAEVFNLCKLLNQSTTCNGHSRQHVCAEYQWIYRLHPHKDEWVLLNTNIRVLSLPTKAPNWSVFSALHQIAEQSCLTYSKFSNLRIERPNDTWTEIEVSNIIASLEASMIFTNRQHIDYLLEFLKISQAVDCVIVQDKIEKLIKQCFQVINVQQLQQPEILTSLKKLIQLIEPQRRFKLQKVQTSDETIKNILPELYKLNLKCLLVYAPFEPPSNPSGARLDDRSANFLLVYLTKLLQNPLGEYQQFADYMVEQVLTQESAPRLLAASPDLQIIRGYNYKEHRNQLYSYKELSELHQRSSLYSTSGLMLSRLAEALQEAISDRQIVLISSAKANVLAKDSVLRTISRCDSEGCRKLIKTRPDLAASEHRANLLKELAALKITEELRYLLHGNKAKYDVISTQLFVVSGDTSPGSQVWEKIGRQVLEKSDESWRLINRDLANQILPDVQSSLGITELRAEAVVELIERDFEEQGADCLDTTGWSDVEYDELLWHLYSTDKQVLWKELKLHKAENNQRVSVVDSRTYLKIDLNRNSHCPKNLAALVTLIQLNPNPKIQKGQQAWIALWTPQTALYVMLSESSSYQYCSLIMETLEQAIPAWKTLPSQEVEVLEKQLRETAWLSTRSSTQGLPPNHIVKLPQNLVKYEASILALQSGHSETVLDSSIHKHKEAYQWLSQQFKVYDSLDILSLILGNV